ncbi:hypothetical protein G7054_g10283 [Neopestalotiopsis clavispora]|nr:hypothetical protein G7054_g10283 [Neopestalotiopsis clavispora]
MEAYSDIPYESLGLTIRKCTVPGTVALTFDDGPWFFTDYVMDSLARYGARATFFLNVWPHVNVNTRPEYWQPVVRRMLAEGHQIGIHTWGHENLDTLTDVERMATVKKATDFFAQPGFLNGTRPMYVRPPFGECSVETGCVEVFTKAGYRLVYWDWDSNDWKHDAGELAYLTTEGLQEKLDTLTPAVDSLLVLMHDNRVQTAMNVEDFLGRITKAGFTPVTVGECIGDVKEKWYNASTANSMIADSAHDHLAITHQALETRGHAEVFGLLLLMAMSIGAIIWAMQRFRVLRKQVFKFHRPQQTDEKSGEESGLFM